MRLHGSLRPRHSGQRVRLRAGSGAADPLQKSPPRVFLSPRVPISHLKRGACIWAGGKSSTMDMKFPRDCPASLSWRSQMAAFFNDAARFPTNAVGLRGWDSPCMHPSPRLQPRSKRVTIMRKCRTRLKPQKHDLKGVSTGDFEEALTALLGKEAGGLSASTVARLKEIWSDEQGRWSKRDLSNERYVYFWVDGIHVQARRPGVTGPKGTSRSTPAPTFAVREMFRATGRHCIYCVDAQSYLCRRPFGVAIFAPARMAMAVGTAPESPPGASAKARGCSVPRPGAPSSLSMVTIPRPNNGIVWSTRSHRTDRRAAPHLQEPPPGGV